MSNTFDKETISKLQDIRRANNAILGCSQILQEHDVLKECIPDQPGPYLQLTTQQACGLMFAIEACARFTDDLFTEYLEDRGILWTDEHLPEVRKAAESAGAFQRGEIDFEQFKKENGIDPRVN